MSPFPRGVYRGLERYAPDRRPVEVDLSDNTNLWGPHPAARRALAQAGPERLARYPSVWADRLREAGARAFGVPAESVATGCGSDDLLDSAFRAVCDPGTPVVFPEPTFSMIPVFARMNALEPVGVPTPSLAELDPDDLLRPDPGLIYLCGPNNPTGEPVPEDLLDALLARVGDDGPVVLLDEAYADFGRHSFVERAAGSRRLVVLRTLSKAYGLAGLRVGLAAGPPEVVAELEKSRGPYKVGALVEDAAVAALEDDSGWVREGVRRVRKNRERLAAALRERRWSPLPSQANFLLVPASRPPGGARALTAGLRERGVAVRPFPDLPGIGDAVRVSVGPWDLLERFLRALDEVAGP